MVIRAMPSPNFDDRAGGGSEGKSPSYIILHYTGTDMADEAARRFCDPAPSDGYGRLSCHYMIDEAGEVIQFVEEAARAWHAGKSYWRGIEDMNSASIGIEIWNRGHRFGGGGQAEKLPDFLAVQMDQLVELLREIVARHDIPPHHILGHSDIAPGRKIDPGEHFPWDVLAAAGLGVLPDFSSDSISHRASHDAQNLHDHPIEFFKLLHQFGYDPRVDDAVILREFHRHYAPHLLEVSHPTLESCAAILSLLEQIDQDF
ncbi:MAG: N-acetylmuramoyl-L-alanine amidase [Alphaproteobacteria bacterium]|nr:N-acetylmuramoyl-L-alanine amidase [Alphaproteobacteria bacterium]